MSEDSNPHATLDFMTGVRDSLVAIHARLLDCGYQFEKNEFAMPGPEPGVRETIDRIESLLERSLPTVLKHLWTVVGPVDFCGTPPSSWTGCSYPDPVVVLPSEYALHELREYLLEFEDDPAFDEEFFVPISPDFYTKAGFSGGELYQVMARSSLTDPWLVNEPHKTTLSEYLRLVIDHGGFPGVPICRHTWPVEELGAGLSGDCGHSREPLTE